MISIEGLRKSYGDTTVLNVDHLSISGGESVVLSGGNGSGKSTLLRVLAGVSRPDDGQVHFSSDIIHGSLGYLPQRGGLYDDLTVRENLWRRRKLHGKKEANCKDEWYVENLGLGPFLETRVEKLSGGYRRLAAIASVFHAEPSWVLLDEPFAGIDDTRREVLESQFSQLGGKLSLLIISAPASMDTIENKQLIQMSDGRVNL